MSTAVAPESRRLRLHPFCYNRRVMVDGKQRRKSRKVSLQVLFANDVVGFNTDDVLAGKAQLPNIGEIDDYARGLIEGTIKNMNEIDGKLVSVSEN